MTHRVVHWGTGNVGRHALAGVLADPRLELVGVHVSGPEKAGRDAAELAGTPTPSGILATTDTARVLAARPDCVVYTAMTDNRLMDALTDLRMLLAAGINVVASAPVFLQYPWDVLPADLLEPVEQAAAQGGSSLFVNGIDPGFANDLLPLALLGSCRAVEQVRCLEIVDYSTYDNAAVMFDIMGFGRPMTETPLLLQPGVLSLAWGSVVRQLAAGLGVELDAVTQDFERLPAPETFDIDSGTIAEGTAAALRFEVRGMVGDRAVTVLEHVTRLRADLAPDWPQPARAGGSYRVEVTGEPHYTLDLAMFSDHGDHNHASLVGTAMRLVNAIPAVVAAAPGIRTTLDLPLVTGTGLADPDRLPRTSS
ncbi:diacylglycerol kinase [Nocardia asteroides]|uniref:NAD(P)H-dependent amine dehydrogenase family protein n=1 Tax=Nocardia asteroides TaxID=1824 RepID=UPI001E4D9E53|nr:diacylglycerol kinase [Nocardia asteroides]UGT55333.1 diacylglycerol kinase [Nocardia asteroides]